jgi:hypothetical protein
VIESVHPVDLSKCRAMGQGMRAGELARTYVPEGLFIDLPHDAYTERHRGAGSRPVLADRVVTAPPGARMVIAYNAPFERACLQHPCGRCPSARGAACRYRQRVGRSASHHPKPRLSPRLRREFQPETGPARARAELRYAALPIADGHPRVPSSLDYSPVPTSRIGRQGGSFGGIYVATASMIHGDSQGSWRN